MHDYILDGVRGGAWRAGIVGMEAYRGILDYFAHRTAFSVSFFNNAS